MKYGWQPPSPAEGLFKIQNDFRARFRMFKYIAIMLLVIWFPLERKKSDASSCFSHGLLGKVTLKPLQIMLRVKLL